MFDYAIFQIFFRIFHTESGTIETHKVRLNTDDHKLKKEPKPGESYFKLKSELSRKINEKRREAVYKRLEEEQKHTQANDEDDEELDDEFEEYSDCGLEDDECEEKEVCEMDATETENANMAVDDASGSENEANESDSSVSDEEIELETQNGTTKRRRIVTAFNDDSDDGK